jgi:hypothetical protein
MKLNAKLLKSFKHNGRTRFLYELTGSAEAIDTYCEHRGEYLELTDDGNNPKFYTYTYGGKKCVVSESSSGEWFVDDSAALEAEALVSQFSGVLAEKLAEKLAERLAQNFLSEHKPVKAPEPEPEPESEEEDPQPKL